MGAAGGGASPGQGTTNADVSMPNTDGSHSASLLHSILPFSTPQTATNSLTRKPQASGVVGSLSTVVTRMLERPASTVKASRSVDVASHLPIASPALVTPSGTSLFTVRTPSAVSTAKSRSRLTLKSISAKKKICI